METVPIFGVSECKSWVHERQIMLNLTLHDVPFFTLHNVKVVLFYVPGMLNSDVN